MKSQMAAIKGKKQRAHIASILIMYVYLKMKEKKSMFNQNVNNTVDMCMWRGCRTPPNSLI